MMALRLAAIAFGVLVIAGEIFRSWGERDLIMWLDDVMVGAALIAAAVALRPETPRRRAIFSATWGFALGIIYISFFDKVVLAEAIGPGVEINRLNMFVTLEVVLAAAGLVASLVFPFQSSP